MKDLTHLDVKNQPKMVDVSHKAETVREATASGNVILTERIVEKFQDGDMITKKGAVIQTAIIAGTMAVKKTSEMIPFCHPLMIEKCAFTTSLQDHTLTITCTVKITGKTGVEMEALTGVSVAALTVYDMCKAMSHDIVIDNVRLIKKTGGKSDVGEF